MEVIASTDIVVFMCYTVKALHMLIIFMPIQIRNYYYPHFMDEKSETEMLNDYSGQWYQDVIEPDSMNLQQSDSRISVLNHSAICIFVNTTYLSQVALRLLPHFFCPPPQKNLHNRDLNDVVAEDFESHRTFQNPISNCLG